METVKFSQNEISDIVHSGVLYDENDNLLFKVVKERILSFDNEKNSCDVEITIQDCTTKKKYKACLLKSSWAGEALHNIKQEWKEVITKSKAK